MSQIEELIQRLCQGAVEYKKIGDVCTTITDYTAAGSFADIAKHVKYLTGDGYAQLIRTTDLKGHFSKTESFIYVDETAFKYLWRVNLDCEGLVMPNVGNCGEVYFISPDMFPNKYNVLGPNAIWVRSNYVSNRFLYHLFLSNNFQRKLAKIVSPTGQTKFNKTNFKEISIPVPPLEVQQEIVRILDQFTQLTAELTAELTARKQQYQYYRDKLLKREGNVTQSCPLKNVCLSIADGDHMPPPKSDSGVPFITISNITENKSIDFSNVMYVPQAYYDKMADKRKARKGDILYTVVGSFGTPVYISEDTKFVFQRHIAILRPDQDKINPRYMYYAMQSTDFYRQADKAAKGAAQRTIGLASLGNMQIPLPPLPEQRRIVAILDRFDALCNDLTSGLPAEIAARQKQYEYYRDKLLTFKERET